ncbi:MAG TPA: transcription antitermination factor NusB [Pyrinomonadaceae bacterium]
MGSRRKARECALQMLFAADVVGAAKEAGERPRADELVRVYWDELADPEVDEAGREFATRLVVGALARRDELDERIRSRAEHWRISRMAVVDRNILRLAVYEFLYELTPRTVAINEALEIARRFSTYEATQFINGILDAIKRDLDRERPQDDDKLDRSEEAIPEVETASDAEADSSSNSTAEEEEAPQAEASDTAGEASAESDGEQVKAVNSES